MTNYRATIKEMVESALKRIDEIDYKLSAASGDVDAYAEEGKLLHERRYLVVVNRALTYALHECLEEAFMHSEPASA